MQGNGRPHDAFIPAGGATHWPVAEVGQCAGSRDRVRMALDSHGDWLGQRHFWLASQAHSAECAFYGQVPPCAAVRVARDAGPWRFPIGYTE